MGGLPDSGGVPPTGPLPSPRTSALALRTRRTTTPDLPWRPWTWCGARRPSRVWSWSGAARILGGDKEVAGGSRAKQLAAKEQCRTKFLVPNQQLLKQLANPPTFCFDSIPRDQQGGHYIHLLPRSPQCVPRQHSNLLLPGAGRLVPNFHHLNPQPASGPRRARWLHLQLPLWSAAQPAGSNENLRLPA